MIRFIGIDPGDVWCGFALLEYDPDTDSIDKYFLTETRVFHVPSRASIKDLVYDVMFALPAVVVAEDYAVRPTNFNRFSKGNTLRLLGALELTTEQSLASTWRTVPPAPWETNLPKMAGGMIDRWSPDWAQSRHKNWGHAKSAWRVLFAYMMQKHPDILNVLRMPECVQSYRRIRSVLYSAERRCAPADMNAPAAKWSVPRENIRKLSYLVTSSRRKM